MAWIAQILGWISLVLGVLALLMGLNTDAGAARMAILFAPGLILGGALIAVLGEIGANVERMRQLADKQSKMAVSESFAGSRVQ